ncbi:MAG TPA: ShlB/FhaC/HecB family hemolysin secretion/activation protein [Gemmatimonadaceae bacterium]
MLLALSLLAVLQVATPARPAPPSPPDSAPPSDGATMRADTGRASASSPNDGTMRADSGEARGQRGPVRRVPLTPALLASAYRDPVAKDLVTRARAARTAQDSSLVSYDATAKQRLTVGIALRESGRDRLLLRSEEAARVRWREGRGARVDVLGARAAFPMAFRGVRVLDDMLDAELIPYFPGREGLMRLAGVQRVGQRDHGIFVHPLDAGAEAYYQYHAGDSVSYRMPDGRRIRLREIRVTAREARPDVIVGSLWFDVASAHLVRAVYRPAAPWDIVRYVEQDDPHAFEDVPRAVRPLIFPMIAEVDAFTVEYGLHEQRWWLPRLETVKGRARMGIMRSPFSMEATYRYASVNGTDSLPPIDVSGVESDSARRERLRARRDSLRTARHARGHHGGDDEDADLRGLDCTPGDTVVERRRLFDGAVPAEIRIPCDTAMLAHSPELPPSIFAPGEEEFGLHERDELVKALSPSLQPGWHPLPPSVHYGLDRGMLRYNRVEGLSAGVLVERTFGEGLAGDVSARIGTADLEPNAELQLRRSAGTRWKGIGIYRRLASAGDWGDPFSVGSSLSALVLGRDEGFYFRSWGAELRGNSLAGAPVEWRLFAERQSDAPVETQVSIPNALHGSRFIANLHAARASAYGLALRAREAYGLDPYGWRLMLDARGEGATGTFDYARAALDLTVGHPVALGVSGSLTAGAGYSAGRVPPQRLWYLGGTNTVRGQPAGEMAGDAYWFTRTELAYGRITVRPVLFFDLGWAGARGEWASPGRPMSGAGAGASFFDGLIRFDLARGIHPDHGWRGDLYLESRF